GNLLGNNPRPTGRVVSLAGDDATHGHPNALGEAVGNGAAAAFCDRISLVVSPGGGLHETARLHQRDCWLGCGMAAGGARAQRRLHRLSRRRESWGCIIGTMEEDKMTARLFRSKIKKTGGAPIRWVDDHLDHGNWAEGSLPSQAAGLINPGQTGHYQAESGGDIPILSSLMTGTEGWVIFRTTDIGGMTEFFKISHFLPYWS